jgi:hypothetical protein
MVKKLISGERIMLVYIGFDDTDVLDSAIGTVIINHKGIFR